MRARPNLHFLHFLGAAALLVLPSQAAVLFTYNGFSSTTGLTLVGDAATASTSDGTVLRVTPAAGGQAGAAYSTTAVQLGANDTFSTTFEFRFTDPGGWDPADGITFVLAASPSGLGGAGIGMGYGGVSNSVAIEFDTYNNGSVDSNSSNHVAIDENGNIANGNSESDQSLANVYGVSSCGFPTNGVPPQNNYLTPGCMSNGDLWSVTIGYDGTSLSASLWDMSGAHAETSPFTAYTGTPINIASFLGTSQAFVGFTAGTGAGWENHDIINWTFANTATIGGGTTPEPGTIGLMLCGLAGLLGLKRRR